MTKGNNTFIDILFSKIILETRSDTISGTRLTDAVTVQKLQKRNTLIIGE